VNKVEATKLRPADSACNCDNTFTASGAYYWFFFVLFFREMPKDSNLNFSRNGFLFSYSRFLSSPHNAVLA